MPQRQTPPQPPANPRRRPGPAVPTGWIWLVLLAMVLLALWFAGSDTANLPYIDYSDFLKLVAGKDLKHVTFVGADRIVGEVNDVDHLPDTITNQDKFREHLSHGKFQVSRIEHTELDKLLEELHKGNIDFTQEAEKWAWLGPLTVLLLPALLLLGFLFLFILPRMRDPLGGSFLSNYIKSPARRYERSKMRVTFEDVADMESAKGELQEVVDFLRGPEKFNRLGGTNPQGRFVGRAAGHRENPAGSRLCW